MKVKLNIRELLLEYKLLLFGSILLLTLFQFLIIYKFPGISIYFLPSLNLFLLLLIIYLTKIKYFPTFLIILNLIPILYLDNVFHSNFLIEVLLSSTLFLFFFISLIKYFSSQNLFELKITYLQFPILCFVFYYIFSAIWGLMNKGSNYYIIVELFHFFYFLFAIFIYYLIKDRKQYHIIFYSLFILFFVIAIEYIYYNLFVSNDRFVTVQSGFFPLLIGITFSFILIYKRNSIITTSAIFLLLLFITGMAVTLTRSLWVTSFLTILVVAGIYLRGKNKFTLKKMILLFLLLIIPIMVISDNKNIGGTSKNINTVEYRSESIANPTEDISFLMRVELGYYAIQKFLENPLIGKGLGDYMKLKILPGDSKIYYIDVLYLNLLWKGGTIGVFLFIWLYFRFFKQAIFIYKNTLNLKVKILTLGIIAGFTGFMFLSFLSPLLIKYKYNIIIAIIFAYLEFERNQLELKGIHMFSNQNNI